MIPHDYPMIIPKSSNTCYVTVVLTAPHERGPRNAVRIEDGQ